MSEPLPPTPAKLFIGLFTAEKILTPSVLNALINRFGPVDLVSPWLPFDFTAYYEKEMGTSLTRRIFSFKTLIQQPAIVDIKMATNGLEKKWSLNGKRRINLDPGYLLPERLVLATGKNFSHRIYLDKGIYADLTLVYRKGAFQPLPWTYPGYRQPELQLFFTKVRSKYMNDLSNGSE